MPHVVYHRKSGMHIGAGNTRRQALQVAQTHPLWSGRFSCTVYPCTQEFLEAWDMWGECTPVSWDYDQRIVCLGRTSYYQEEHRSIVEGSESSRVVYNVQPEELLRQKEELMNR